MKSATVNRQSQIGFTLIELLVVITIIAVLLALLTPALDRAIVQAELAKCAANQHALLNITHIYAMDENRRKYPSGVGDDGSDLITFVPADLVRIVEDAAGNRKTATGTATTTWGGTITYGVVPEMLVDVTFADFGYRTSTLGYVIGYNYLGGRPKISQANDGDPWEAWQSPMSMTRPGSGQLIECWNLWASDGPFSWVAHGKEGVSLGSKSGLYHYNGPGAGADVVGLSAGGNVGSTDGSVAWLPIDELKVYSALPDGSATRMGRW